MRNKEPAQAAGYNGGCFSNLPYITHINIRKATDTAFRGKELYGGEAEGNTIGTDVPEDTGKKEEEAPS